MKSIVLALALVLPASEAVANGGSFFQSQRIVQRQRFINQPVIQRQRIRIRQDVVAAPFVQQVYAAPFVQQQVVQQYAVPVVQQVRVKQFVAQPVYAAPIRVEAFVQPQCVGGSCQQLQQLNSYTPAW